MIAHEIRNPLMIIKSALRSLRRSAPLDDGGAAAVADIDEEVVRLNALVNGVLDFARPIKFALAPTSLSALCEDAVAATGADEGAAACAVTLDPAADAVVTDAERLRQVLVNVLTNARQAVAEQLARDAANPPDDPATPVVVERRRAPVTSGPAAIERDRVRIIVARPRHRARPTDARAACSTRSSRRKTTGTGIGLAITRNIVEGLGGSIALTSSRARAPRWRSSCPGTRRRHWSRTA